MKKPKATAARINGPMPYALRLNLDYLGYMLRQNQGLAYSTSLNTVMHCADRDFGFHINDDVFPDEPQTRHGGRRDGLLGRAFLCDCVHYVWWVWGDGDDHHASPGGN